MASVAQAQHIAEIDMRKLKGIVDYVEVTEKDLVNELKNKKDNITQIKSDFEKLQVANACTLECLLLRLGECRKNHERFVHLEMKILRRNEDIRDIIEVESVS